MDIVQAADRLAVCEDVFRDGQAADQRELLKDHADPGRDRVGGRAERDRAVLQAGSARCPAAAPRPGSGSACSCRRRSRRPGPGSRPAPGVRLTSSTASTPGKLFEIFSVRSTSAIICTYAGSPCAGDRPGTPAQAISSENLLGVYLVGSQEVIDVGLVDVVGPREEIGRAGGNAGRLVVGGERRLEVVVVVESLQAPEGHRGVILCDGAGEGAVFDLLQDVGVAVHRDHLYLTLLAGFFYCGGSADPGGGVGADKGCQVRIGVHDVFGDVDRGHGVGLGVADLYDLDIREFGESLTEAGFTVVEHLDARDAQDCDFALAAQRLGDRHAAGVAQVALVGADVSDALGIRQVAQDGHDRDAGIRSLIDLGLQDRLDREGADASRLLGDRLVEGSNHGVHVVFGRTDVGSGHAQSIAAPLPAVLVGVEELQVAHRRDIDIFLSRSGLEQPARLAQLVLPVQRLRGWGWRPGRRRPGRAPGRRSDQTGTCF